MALMALFSSSSFTLLPSSSSSSSIQNSPLVQSHRTHFPPRRIAASALPRELHYSSPPEAHTTTPDEAPSTNSMKTTHKKKKKNNKPRPSFLDQIMERWSLKVPSERTHFPWQEPPVAAQVEEAAAPPKKTQLPAVSLRRSKKRVDFANEIKGPTKSRGSESGEEEEGESKEDGDWENPLGKKIGDQDVKDAVFPSGSIGDGGSDHLLFEEDPVDLEKSGVGSREDGWGGTEKMSSSSSSHRRESDIGGGLGGGDGSARMARVSMAFPWQREVGCSGKEGGRKKSSAELAGEEQYRVGGRKIGDHDVKNAAFSSGFIGNGGIDHLVLEDDPIDVEKNSVEGREDEEEGVERSLSSHWRELGTNGGLGSGDGSARMAHVSVALSWQREVGDTGEERGQWGVSKSRLAEEEPYRAGGRMIVHQDVKNAAFPSGFFGDSGSGNLVLEDDPIDSEKNGVERREDDERGVARSSSSRRRQLDAGGGLSDGDGIERVASVSMALPWQREEGDSGKERGRKRSSTELAERMIPAPELQRLRNAALRVKERTKVGTTGVTEALVERIKEKWRENEVVKLRFEGQPAINMRRIHEALEKKTGGLVIWRSGGSVVLYRGMSYNLPCVQSYTENIRRENTLDKSSRHLEATNEVGFVKHGMRTASNLVSSSEEQANALITASSIDSLLDELGPRYRDWAGRKPLPVDADLLPRVISGYKPSFRFLPYKAKRALRNSEMTYLRRLARSMPPHFALGRNREHHGLAQAMVKLWGKSLIAKIAIKRGVPNTCNDRMAEEIRKLTGGVLLSRNKEFIVFYRGNDFVPSSIEKILVEREESAGVRQDEEEQARQEASNLVMLNAKAKQGLRLAGTLAETIKAKTHWANEPSKREIEKMMADDTLSKHESLIRYMERKLALAQEKVRKAEKTLAKVQESLKPSELPNDLETVSDEERALFRKMGLKMRSFLSLGRRGVFDGTIENMHLNWKYRELVKILVKRKSFLLVKHVAISLEAESGGVLISLDKTTKGYVIIIYRGKNYQRPAALRPRNLLSRRQALARSIELQRCEALKHHISNLRGKIQKMKTELEQMRTKQNHDEDEFTKVDSSVFSDDGDLEEEGEEAYLETYEWHSDDDEDLDDDNSAAVP